MDPSLNSPLDPLLFSLSSGPAGRQAHKLSSKSLQAPDKI
jgi:hypothetical protein